MLTLDQTTFALSLDRGEDTSSPQPLRRLDWALLWLLFGAVVLAYNWVAPLPRSMDDFGLGQICELMERRGWTYCVNQNWGFALPLSSYWLTQLTGDLLVSQRIICAAAAGVSLVLVDQIMASLLGVTSRRLRFASIALMLCSPWMLDSLTSTHMDIVSICFVLCGIRCLLVRQPAMHLVGGFVVAMSCWFRFHYLLYVLLYVPLTMVCRLGQQPVRRALWVIAGIVLANLVPRAVQLAHPEPTTDPYVLSALANLADDFNWSWITSWT